MNIGKKRNFCLAVLEFFKKPIYSHTLIAMMKAQMQRFTEKIVSMMKAERLFESQGGPIILSQVDKFSTL